MESAKSFSPWWKRQGNKLAQNGGARIVCFGGPRYTGNMKQQLGVTVGKKLSNTDLAYIAGFLDGDGAIMAIIERHNEKKYKFRVRIFLEFSQQKSNVDILKYIRDKIGSGSLSISNKQVFKLSIKDKVILNKILPQLLNFSQVKPRQIKIALKILSIEIKDRRDLVTAALLADELSGMNIRSKGRRKNSSKILDISPVTTEFAI